MSPENEDILIREMMSKSVEQMPFTDFEDKMMEQIHCEAKISKSFLKNVRLSWIFFAIGTIFGLTLSVLISQLNTTFMGFSIQKVMLMAQAILVIFALSQFDQLIDLVRNRR